MKKLLTGLLAGLLIGTAGVAFAASGDVNILGGGYVEVEDCPEGYVCLTVEQYDTLLADAAICELLPTFTPISTPGVTPTPEITPTPTETETLEGRDACNRGIGNSGNLCDPGNSYGQGVGDARPAGEDRDENDTGPGNSGSNGNQNDRGK